MFYYIGENDKILLFDTDRQRLERTLAIMPQYQGYEIIETNRNIIYFDGQPEFEDEIQDKLLEKAKEDKIKENDTKRDEALNGGVLYKGILFDSDTDQKVNLLATAPAMSDEQTITWFGMNNEPLECTKEDLINIGGLITYLHSYCWNVNADTKHAISQAETMEELDEIVIDYSIDDGEEESEV